jgi:hypothetical protein
LYDPIIATGGVDSVRGADIVIDTDFTNVNAVSTIYLDKVDTFDWIDNPWSNCVTPSVELCNDELCNSPCNTGSGTNDCYAYISSAPDYNLIV